MVTSDADEDRLGLEVMVELLPAAVVEGGVDEGVEEPDPPPTPAEIRPPPVPPTPRDTPPLPRDTPIRGSPLELVVVKVTSDADVDWLGLDVMVESPPKPTLADARPLTPSVTPPLPRDTPRIGSPLELVVVKVTSEADVDWLGLDVIVESTPKPTLADARLLTPSVTPPLPREMPIIGSPLELVVVKVVSEAEEVRLGLEVMVESPRPTLADTRELTPSVTSPLPREIPIIGSPLELVVVKVVSDAVVVLGLEVMVESPRPTLADTRVLTPSVTPPLPREMPRIGSPFELVVVKVTSEAVVEVLGLCVIVELALLLMGPALAEELVVEAAEEDELLVLPIGSASESPLDVDEAGAVEFALLLIVPALAEELEVIADELVIAGAEELVELAELLIGPALAEELLVLLIGPAVASPLDVVELALLLIGPPVEAPLEVGPAEVVELALLLIGPLAVGIMEEVMFPLMVDERVGLIGPA